MASFNKVILIGRVAWGPELRYTTNGTAVCNFKIAVDRRFSKNDETDFIRVVAWQRLAEICGEFLTRGKLIALEGRLQVDDYTDREGQKRTRYEVVAENMQMLDRRDDGSGDGQRGRGPGREPVGASAASFGSSPGLEPGVSGDSRGGALAGDEGPGMSEDDIPF